MSILYRIVFVIAIVAATSAIAETANESTKDNTSTYEDNNDPFEDFNRVIFEINQAFDIILFRPMAELYGTVPSPIRKSIHNAVSNLSSPVILVNDVLQGDGERAAITLGRIIINSTIGILGLFDVATDMGLEYHSEDFGQTLAAAGIGGGPYIIIPILGPSTPRDLIGKIVDVILQPLNWVAWNNNVDWAPMLHRGVDMLDRRTDARELTDRTNKSMDPYAKYRSLYIQNREYKIRNEEVDTSDLPSPDNQE